MSCQSWQLYSTVRITKCHNHQSQVQLFSGFTSDLPSHQVIAHQYVYLWLPSHTMPSNQSLHTAKSARVKCKCAQYVAAVQLTWQQQQAHTHTSTLHKHAAYNSTQMLIAARHAQLFELTTTTTRQRIINQGGGGRMCSNAFLEDGVGQLVPVNFPQFDGRFTASAQWQATMQRQHRHYHATCH